jgi:hypothetical protein
MRSVRDVRFVFVLTTLLSGQTPAQVPERSQEDARAEVVRKRRLEYPDLFKVADLAQSAPAELAADALLRVAASARNRDRAWKIELLEESFQMAALARQPNRQKIIGSRMVDRSRAEILSLAFDQRLDRLSLQGRIVRQMLKLDKAKALEMFQRTAWPGLRGRQCRDALVDHVAEYYELVAEIGASAFTAEQRRRGDHFDLLSLQISRIGSPVEVGPAAKLLAGSSLTQDELSLLSARLAASIDRIESDDRSFSASYSNGDEGLHELARTLGADNASIEGIIGAYRRYLVRNLAGKRCADTAGGKFASSVMDSFNRSFAAETGPARAPLAADELKPAKMEGQAEWDPFIDEAEFQQAWDEYLNLLLGKEHGPLFRSTRLSDAQKDTVEWRAQFDHFLEQIDDLRPTVGEPEYRYFYRKATALTGALSVAPSGPDREKVLHQFVAFLSSSSFQQDSVLEWHAQVNRTASSVRALGPEATARFFGELERSGNPILYLYSLEAKIIPDNRD